MRAPTHTIHQRTRLMKFKKLIILDLISSTHSPNRCVKTKLPTDCPDCYSLVEREVDLLKDKLEELKEIMSDVDAPTIEVNNFINILLFESLLMKNY